MMPTPDPDGPDTIFPDEFWLRSEYLRVLMGQRYTKDTGPRHRRTFGVRPGQGMVVNTRVLGAQSLADDDGPKQRCNIFRAQTNSNFRHDYIHVRKVDAVACGVLIAEFSVPLCIQTTPIAVSCVVSWVVVA